MFISGTKTSKKAENVLMTWNAPDNHQHQVTSNTPIEKLDVKNDVKKDVKNGVKNDVKNDIKNDVKNYVKTASQIT